MKAQDIKKDPVLYAKRKVTVKGRKVINRQISDLSLNTQKLLQEKGRAIREIEAAKNKIKSLEQRMAQIDIEHLDNMQDEKALHKLAGNLDKAMELNESIEKIKSNEDRDTDL